MPAQKLYCYVDETGQDTKGQFFLVAVVLQNKEKIDTLRKNIEDLEHETGKKKLKWSKSHFTKKQAYISALPRIKEVKGTIFYSSYQETKEYTPLIATTIAKSILSKVHKDYTATIIVDGLNKKEMLKVRQELKSLRIKYRKIRGMKDEQDALLRLADSVAGFLRDYEEKQKYTEKLFNLLRQARVVTKV